MNLIFNQQSKLWFRKPVLVRSSPLLSNGFSSSSPCDILFANPRGAELERLIIRNVNEYGLTCVEKKVPLDLVDDDQDEMLTVGSCNGWVATLKKDRILRLQERVADPKEIPLPRFKTLPHCQTQIITNVSMSSSSPEDEDCVVAVKFLGPQLSFYRPAQRNSGWINKRIENPCFFSTRVMFSKKDESFCIPGSGGHIIGSWDLEALQYLPRIQELRFKKLPKQENRRPELLDSCCKSEHLVESRTSGDLFLVKWYKKTLEIIDGVAKMKTEDLIVYKLDDEGNAVSTSHIGDLCIFLSKAEPFCVPARTFPGLRPNRVYIFDPYEEGYIDLASSCIHTHIFPFKHEDAPYHIPPKIIDE